MTKLEEKNPYAHESYEAMLMYVYKHLSMVTISSSLKNPHVNFAYILIALLDMHFKLHGIEPYKNAGE